MKKKINYCAVRVRCNGGISMVYACQNNDIYNNSKNLLWLKY